MRADSDGLRGHGQLSPKVFHESNSRPVVVPLWLQNAASLLSVFNATMPNDRRNRRLSIHFFMTSDDRIEPKLCLGLFRRLPAFIGVPEAETDVGAGCCTIIVRDIAVVVHAVRADGVDHDMIDALAEAERLSVKGI